ncbi:MAG: thiamine phosphate synthase [Micavibrio sp.]
MKDTVQSKPPKDVKEGAPSCGLYFSMPDDVPLEQANRMIREAAFVINRSSYERNMNVLELGAGIGDAEALERLVTLVAVGRREGMVVIIRNDAELAKDAEADGVILDDPDALAAAREMVGPDGIMGLRCGLSRASAEKALALEVDYVSFHAAAHHLLPPESLISWWSVKTDIPCLVEGGLTNDDCARYVRAGATFVEASFYVWDHPQGIKQGTVDMLYAIDLAMENITFQ